jgi:hypothetical protein
MALLFPRANRETFEETSRITTSRITNISTTMFPSLARALEAEYFN